MTPDKCSGKMKNDMHKYKLNLILIIAILTTANVAFAQLKPIGPIVTSKLLLSVDKLRPGDDFQMAVQATVKKGHHIGAADKDALYPAAVTFSAPKGIKLDKPVWPKAERKEFKINPGHKIPVYQGTIVIRVKGHVAKTAKPGNVTFSSSLTTQACAEEMCYPPATSKASVKAEIVAPGTKISSINKSIFLTAGTASLGGGDEASRFAGKSPVVLVLMLYGLGLLLAFTPCVYPMVPVTVGYFSTQGESGTKRVAMLAGVYVLGLALTYSILGAVAATTGGVFGAAMQMPAVIIGIALVLIALALSMFGLYELRPPAFIENRASGRSGVMGALVMGLIFGIVCAPCVGPVVLGLLLFVAKMGSPLMGFLLFFVLALGLGTPLFFLAAFSAKMPVPGMWMVAVKKLAGFLLLGAAAHFVRPLVPEPVSSYMIPVVVIAAGMWFAVNEKSLHANKVAKPLGKAFGITALVVGVVMAMPGAKTAGMKFKPYSPAALTQAAKAGHPVMIDFTAKWCTVCQELEHGPFSDPAVIKAASGVTLLRVDGTKQNDPKIKALEKQYNVHGYPAVIFIDQSGKEVKSARVAGYIESKEFINRIKSLD